MFFFSQPPQDPPKWDGVFSAVNRLSSCAQTVFILPNGSEDCLQLDVYTPEHIVPGTKLPVIMFLHGGAYYYGTKLHYDPEFLVTKNTVAVIVNYRVGVLGFLCLSGVANLGLKDQAAALKWIKKNIASFGGDPDNVTICGQSAGASSAAMHLLSPSSKGLFHKAILLSGSPLSPWAFNVEPLKPALEDANKLSSAETAEDVLRIFQEAPLRDLLRATQGNSIDTRYFKYSPCVDTNSSDPFFPGKPYDLLKQGQFNKVPMILGYADVEGLLFYGLHNSRSFKEFDENFLEKLPSVFSWCSDEDKRKISEKIRRHYFGRKPISEVNIKGVVDYYSDWIAYSSIDAFSRLMSSVSNQPVYNYVFSYEGGRNFAKFIFGSRVSVEGASHSDDIFYIFKPAGLSLLLSNKDKLFIDRLTTMLTNFMRTG